MDNVTADQQALLDELAARDSQANVEWDEYRGVAASVRGKLSRRPPRNSKTLPAASVERFLKRYAPVFGPPDLVDSLRPLRSRVDDLGWTHVELQHWHSLSGDDREREIEIYGSKVVAHVDPGGSIVEVQSSCWRESPPVSEPRVTRIELRSLMEKRIEGVPGHEALEARLREQGEKEFPIMQRPRLVFYPWLGSLRLAWATYAYGVVDVDEDEAPKALRARKLALGQTFVDATTGELILFAPTRRDLDTDRIGSGRGVTPLGGPLVGRSLRTVKRTYPRTEDDLDPLPDYFLWDRTLARQIVTYDAACAANLTSKAELAVAVRLFTAPKSKDSDNNWERLPMIPSAAQRTAGQQPEVDAHFFAREAYVWYDALAGGRDGWDDGQYPNPPVPKQRVSVFTHVHDDGPPPSCQSINAFMQSDLSNGRWYAFLGFHDGDGTNYEYLAGSKAVFGHEYQHAITEFSFQDGFGNPGLMPGAAWHMAVHEGLSDVFGSLFSEQWLPGTDISPVGRVLRNIVFPRDDGPPPPTAAYFPDMNDHFADRNLRQDEYQRGTILAHCAFLMGNGGVHQRAARIERFIPVSGLGHETINGVTVLKAGRIWYRALTYYFSTHGALTGIPNNDENTFRTLRTACVSAASDLYGPGSREHRTTALAFYAVGLQPWNQAYGPDVTFLPWGVDWALSRPYTGLPSPDWASLDLFVNNGGASNWNAIVNILDENGTPTQFENTVYCRVRNVGEDIAWNVSVQLFYAKVGTAPTGWLPVTNSAGVVQTLNPGNIFAGQTTFPDADQDTPPAAAGVSWYIPPLAPGEVVDHFCLRAVVTADNDVNPHNNEVQSNVAYASYVPGSAFRMAFVAGNPGDEEIPLELELRAELPAEWRARLIGAGSRRRRLKPGEEREVTLAVQMPKGADAALEPPLDGYVRGRLAGALTGSFSGVLTDASWEGERLEARLSGTVEGELVLVGGFVGKLNRTTGEMKGTVTGRYDCLGREGSHAYCAVLTGCLRPWRRVNVSQRVGDRILGGITLEVHVVPREGSCVEQLPPTTTTVLRDDPQARQKHDEVAGVPTRGRP